MRGHVRNGARVGRGVVAARPCPDRAAAADLPAVLRRSGGQGVSSGVGNFGETAEISRSKGGPMPSFAVRFANRRRLLQWLSASPLLASPGFALGGVDRPSKLPELEANAPLIGKPEEAINVFDFEPVFFKNVPPAHIGYMASGIDAEATLKANREAFSKYYLRPRRLNDVSKVDTSVEILGVKYPNPIFICPTGGNKAYHPEGEAAVARAAKIGGHLEMLATPATTSMEDAIAARGAPVWYQLYASPQWEVAEAPGKRPAPARSPVVGVAGG